MADTCPGCLRHRGYGEGDCPRYESLMCSRFELIRLRARVSELERSQSARDMLMAACAEAQDRVTELESALAAQSQDERERGHLEAIYRCAKRSLASHQFEKLEDAKRHILDLEAERARLSPPVEQGAEDGGVSKSEPSEENAK